MNIFFDLDGTLINSKLRVYTLFNELVKITKLSFDEYWRLKRSMFSNEWILKHIYSLSHHEINYFNQLWLKRIEENDLLKLDICFDYTMGTIKALYKNHNLYVVTSRQNEQAAILQIETLQLKPFFIDVLVTKQSIEKHELIGSKKIRFDKNDFFVGDTGIDIQAGKHLEIKTIAVLSGFRNYESLIAYKPDYVLNSIVELPNILK